MTAVRHNLIGSRKQHNLIGPLEKHSTLFIYEHQKK